MGKRRLTRPRPVHTWPFSAPTTNHHHPARLEAVTGCYLSIREHDLSHLPYIARTCRNQRQILFQTGELFFRANLCEVSCVCIHRPENQSVRKLSGHKRVILWVKPDPWTGGNRKRPTFSHDAETANDKRSCGDWDSDFLFLITFVCASPSGKFFFHSNGTP